MPESHAKSLYPAASTGRPSKIAVIGAGAVGTAVAYACAMRGDARAVFHRRELSEEMSADQIAAAQRAAREWLSVH